MEKTDRDNHKSNPSAAEAHDNEQWEPSALEPYVTADVVAQFIGESRRNVLRMARDIEKLRRPSGTASERRSNTRTHNK
jgi:hypothetical protein